MWGRRRMNTFWPDWRMYAHYDRMYADRHKWPLSRAKVELWHEKAPATGCANIRSFPWIIYLEGELVEEQRSRCCRSRSVAR